MSAPVALALEIGGTKLQAAVGTYEGKLLECVRGEAPSGATALEILAWFEEHVPSLIQRSGGGDTRGAGIGFGGPVNTQTGHALVSHQVDGWEDFPLKDWCRERFSLECRVVNDANAAGWAEYRCGRGRGARTFCYMNVGSGIGGALVLDGKLHDGQGLGAFEIGHLFVSDPTASESGEVSRLERLYSGWSFEKLLREGPSPLEGTELHRLSEGDAQRLSCAMVAEAARTGDDYARAVIEDLAHGLGIAIANCITLIHPERFVLGGGVSLMGEVLLEPIRAVVDKHVFVNFRNRYEILPAELGEDVVVVGAMLLAAGNPKE